MRTSALCLLSVVCFPFCPIPFTPSSCGLVRVAPDIDNIIKMYYYYNK